MLAVGLGGHNIGWNESLQSGFWQTFTMILFVGSGYLCLSLAMSEILSALPFTGGTYGIVRVALGPFIGYLTGWCELIQNLLMTMVTLSYLSYMFMTSMEFNPDYEPIVWVIFFLLSFVSHIIDRPWYWKMGLLFASSTIIIWLLYIVGTSHGANFDKYHSMNSHHSDNAARKGFTSMPYSSWFFMVLNICQILGKDSAMVRSFIIYSFVHLNK